MSFEQVSGLIRHLLTFAGGYFVAKGVVDEATATTIVSGVAALVGVVWSWYAKSQTTA